jgi:UDP-N-acetylmuramoyl-tripeptide--D-alanyl-D-alanine ligase
MVLSIIQWWVTPKLPKEHIFISLQNRPKGSMKIARVYFKKWVIHPIKRRIAKYYLLFLQNFFGITVIGITGSAGKTTTKEMLASILKQKGETVYSRENIDPIYNIPTTILSARPSTRYLVLEMGVEYPGEIDFYLWLAHPHVGVITNIFPTHTLYLKSIKGVAREKGKLVKFLGKGDFAVLNSENEYCRKIGGRIKSPIIWFGEKGTVKSGESKFCKDLSTKFELYVKSSKIDIHLPCMGKQFVQNALAASAASLALGAKMEEIKKGLENFSLQLHRMDLVRLANGNLLIDDSYNNNPEAAKETLKNFQEISKGKSKIIVFGDMLELGELKNRAHREAGEMIAGLSPEFLLCVGDASRITAQAAKRKLGKNRVEWLPDAKAASLRLPGLIKNNTAVLIKGSRSVGLDKVVDSLQGLTP